LHFLVVSGLECCLCASCTGRTDGLPVASGHVLSRMASCATGIQLSPLRQAPISTFRWTWSPKTTLSSGCSAPVSGYLFQMVPRVASEGHQQRKFDQPSFLSSTQPSTNPTTIYFNCFQSVIWPAVRGRNHVIPSNAKLHDLVASMPCFETKPFCRTSRELCANSRQGYCLSRIFLSQSSQEEVVTITTSLLSH
jgi:hypothetical protein